MADDPTRLSTYPYPTSPMGYNTLVPVEIPAGADAVEVEVPLVPGHRVVCRAVGPDGKPRAGLVVFGRRDRPGFWVAPDGEETFDVSALGPEDRRLVIALDEDERLAGKAVVRGDGPDEVTIALQPWAEATGRLVDDEGEPIAGLYLIADDRVSDPDKAVEVGSVLSPIGLGDDGRFRIVGLLPGLTYSFRLTTAQKTLAEPITGLTVEAGETKDLGDLTVVLPE